MLVRAVARIQHRNFKTPGDEIRRARCGVANHDAVRLHGFECPDRINERLAFFEARGFGLKIHRVGAETRGGGGEADTSASGRLEECEGDGLSAKGGEFLERMTLEFLKWL